MSQDAACPNPKYPVDLVSSLKSLEASFEGAERKLDRIEFEVDQRINDANKGESNFYNVNKYQNDE